MWIFSFIILLLLLLFGICVYKLNKYLYPIRRNFNFIDEIDNYFFLLRIDTNKLNALELKRYLQILKIDLFIIESLSTTKSRFIKPGYMYGTFYSEGAALFNGRGSKETFTISRHKKKEKTKFLIFYKSGRFEIK
jgi:hypothetical protein